MPETTGRRRLSSAWGASFQRTLCYVGCRHMSVPATDSLAPVLTPHGRLLLVRDSDAPSLPAALEQRLTDAFALSSGRGLLHLGEVEVATILPSALAWWRDFAARYVTTLCAVPEGGAVTAPDDQVLDALVADAPPMTGGEYLSTE